MFDEKKFRATLPSEMFPLWMSLMGYALAVMSLACTLYFEPSPPLVQLPPPVIDVQGEFQAPVNYIYYEVPTSFPCPPKALCYNVRRVLPQ